MLTYTRDTNRAEYDVYVDGRKVAWINANGSFLWKQAYTSPIFPADTHIAEFRNTASGAPIMDVDAITVN